VRRVRGRHDPAAAAGSFLRRPRRLQPPAFGCLATGIAAFPQLAARFDAPGVADPGALPVALLVVGPSLPLCRRSPPHHLAVLRDAVGVDPPTCRPGVQAGRAGLVEACGAAPVRGGDRHRLRRARC
jgi:hypothetical protein